ncbi:hypothetical protein BLS_005907 [Venturia inaequalis]|uniref:Peptide N-acetyl-beta-D-glucosaminyl asparaginase amidase A N-terminal domain-containing protein n=1 Tax=Venturia inaequalis TaxID=5025 RepID=A0A8H3UEW2_VENIN|nr:hypothetical protein BLS_005907 [Venturia inaequalis]
MNFTVTSSGRQFDRLAVMYLNDTEIWRTSTAEPTLNGIVWTYTKDVSNYLTLWKQPQRVIFDLGNIVDRTYTGSFDTTLTATFFSTKNVPKPADIIVPLSARRSANGSGSAFMVPEVQAINTFTIPRNVEKAILSLSAVGQAEEEFWWSNVPNSIMATFSNNTLLGFSPFREVQLLVDGEIAGVAWPFPVIFTGGVVPGFWRPEVGIDAFDLKEDEVDLTPWLSVLSDDRDHTYEIRVMGLAGDGQGNAILTTVGNYWVVSGKLFLWLNPSTTRPTIGTLIKLTPAPQFFITSSTTKSPDKGANTTLTYQVLAQRELSFTSTLQTPNGPVTTSWQQTLQYSNTGFFTNGGNKQTNTQMTTGLDVSSSGYSRRFSYPLYVMSSVSGGNGAADGTTGLTGIIDRAKNILITGKSVFPDGLEGFVDKGVFDGWSIVTRQNGSSGYAPNTLFKAGTSYGATEQECVFAGVKIGAGVGNGAGNWVGDGGGGGNGDGGLMAQVPLASGTEPLLSRRVLAVNGSVARDSSQDVNEVVIGKELVQKGDVEAEFAPMVGGELVGGKFIHTV